VAFELTQVVPLTLLVLVGAAFAARGRRSASHSRLAHVPGRTA
jgi:hypothetical protein